ncbi:MAG: hypothetical protein AAGF71_03855 [Pseudomonadota bacterium]
MRVAPLSQLAREAGLSLGNERAYLAPALFWVAHGQGRYSMEGQLRGYTANNVIFVPANVGHSIEISPRCQGTALFFSEQNALPFPDEPMHLRMVGVQAQSEMASMVEEMRVESQGTADSRDLVLYHRAALMLLWLQRQSGKSPAQPTHRVTDMLRAIAQPGR